MPILIPNQCILGIIFKVNGKDTQAKQSYTTYILSDIPTLMSVIVFSLF